MKKIATLLSAVLLCFCFVLSGCSTGLTIPGGEIKNSNKTVFNVGDYVYYANSYVSRDDLAAGVNEKKGVEEKKASINRIKTENGKIVLDEDKKVQNIENVIYKINASENTFMFAYENYLYFTSPNIHKTSSNEYKFKLTSLFRAKLDGNGISEIMTTEGEDAKFFLNKGDKLQIIIYDNSKIKIIEIADKLGKLETLAEEVTACVLPKNDEFISKVYFTKALKEEDGTTEGITGNVLNELNLQTKEINVLRKQNFETITPVAFAGGRLYYTREAQTIKNLYSNGFKSTFAEDEKLHNYEPAITDLTPMGLKNGEQLPLVYKYAKKILIQNFNSLQADVLVNEDATILFVSGDYVYYSTENGIYRVSYLDRVSQQMSDKKDFKTEDISFDGRYLYFYAKVETNTTDRFYCHRVDTYLSERGTIRVELMSELLKADMPKEEE